MLVGFEGTEDIVQNWELWWLMAHVKELLKLSSKMKWLLKTRFLKRQGAIDIE